MRVVAYFLLCSCAVAHDGVIHTHHDNVPAFGADATLTAPDASTPDESFRINGGTTIVIQEGQAETCREIYIDGRGEQPAILIVFGNLRCETILPDGPNASLKVFHHGRVTIRDLPFDHARDPEEFGHGIINIDSNREYLGELTRQSKASVSREIKAGDSTIELTAAPVNWQPGDELWLPDNRHHLEGVPVAEHVEIAHVASVSGSTVTLTAPVSHDHLGSRDETGVLDELFSVANVTQDVVIESENPNGVRGHQIAIGACDIDCEGYTLRELGRTTTAPLDSTTFNADGTVAKIGTNQIARYPEHDHGNVGRMNTGKPYQWRRMGYSIVGSPKLGRVLHHDSHFGLDENFAIVDCAGFALITETPGVYGNTVRDWIIIGKRLGSPERITSRAGRNVAGGDHWHPNGGLGLQSAANEFTNGEIYSVSNAIGMAGFGTTQLRFPAARGVMAAVDGWLWMPRWNSQPEGYPFLFPSSIKAMGCLRGIETWGAHSYPMPIKGAIGNAPAEFTGLVQTHMFDGLKLIHCRFPTDLEDQLQTTIRGWKIRGDFSLPQAPLDKTGMNPATLCALHFKEGYDFGTWCYDCEFSGYAAGYRMWKPSNKDGTKGAYFERCKFACRVATLQPDGQTSRAKLGTGWTGWWKDCTFAAPQGCDPVVLMTAPSKDVLELDRGEDLVTPPVTYLFDPAPDGRVLKAYHWWQTKGTPIQPPPAGFSWGGVPEGATTTDQVPVYGAVTPEWAESLPEFATFRVATLEPPKLTETFEQNVLRRLHALDGETFTPPEK